MAVHFRVGASSEHFTDREPIGRWAVDRAVPDRLIVTYGSTMAIRNWAGNVTYTPAAIEHPSSVDELRDIVMAAERVHVLGTRHSFNDIADSDRLIDLAAMPDEVVIDDGRTVELNPTMTYGRLAPLLRDAGLALHNLASLPHISIGGAIATGTHGSGDQLGNLATAVAAIEIMRSDGEVMRLDRGDDDFDGVVVGLGALGVVLRVQLDLEPEYQIAQHVFLHLEWQQLVENVDQITAAGHSVSMFTRWTDDVSQVWIKRRVDEEQPPGDTLFGARPATVGMHPAGAPADRCTQQLGVPGSWSDRLPHFKMGFTPSSGHELQSELLLPRASIVEAIEVFRSFGPAMADHLRISEIRTVAADRLWMSGQYERETVAIHCTWLPHPVEVAALVEQLEHALAPLQPRPHWAKLFAADRHALAQRYPRHADFVDLVERFDPTGTFRNDWLTRNLLG